MPFLSVDERGWRPYIVYGYLRVINSVNPNRKKQKSARWDMIVCQIVRGFVVLLSGKFQQLHDTVEDKDPAPAENRA